MIRIAERLNAVQFIEQTGTEKLKSYASMNNREKAIENGIGN
jgi:hypothetical protein